MTTPNTPTLPKRAEAGAVIGGYELVRRIGRGGMAEVWVARRPLGQKGTKFVAIKLIADHFVGDERYTRMFRAEAELAAVLSHANIVQVFDEGEDGGRSYLVMEWVDGLNLLKLGAVLSLLDDEDRRFRVTSYIIGQLLYALGYAHSITSYDGSPLGVVHRDVSPQNVLVSNHGEVKLTDFGVAHTVMEESSGVHVKGKVRYMAPEQLAGKTRSPTLDLYAVGALLHELLDGKKFRGTYEGGQEMFAAVLSGEIPPLTRPAPPELDELRVRLLQPDPTKRIQTAEEAIHWLRRYPGHGDARSELTELCGSLTGVVRPRVGPGQSSQAPMAERKTLQFQGLAKPKINLPGSTKKDTKKRAKKITPPPSPRAKVPGSRTSSTTAVQSPSRDPGEVPVISGGTVFVRPQSLPAAAQGHTPGPRLAAVGTTRHPGPAGVARLLSTPAPAIGHPTAPPPTQASGGNAPMPAQGVISLAAPARASNPIPTSMHGQGLGSPPTYGSPQPHPAPSHVGEQPSYPLMVDGQSALKAEPQVHSSPTPVPTNRPHLKLASTERLPGPESEAPPLSGGTEVFDLNMVAEISSAGVTDHDIRPRSAGHEGTDTSHDALPRSLPAPQTNGPGLSRASVVGIALGLMLVAVSSVTLTWWIVEGRGSDEAKQATQAAALSAEDEPKSPEVSKPEPPRDPRAGGPTAGPQNVPAALPPVQPSQSTSPPTGELPQTPPVEIASEELELEEITPEPPAPEEAAPEEAAPEEPTPKKDPPKPSKPKLFIKGPAGAQVKVATKIITVPKRGYITKKFSPGRRQRLIWRPSAKANWKMTAPVDLLRGHTVKLYISNKGIERR